MRSIRSIFCALIGSLLLLSGCVVNDLVLEIPGTLQGRVIIGPLCPVEPCDLPPERVAQIYQARKIFVYEQPSGAKVAQTALAADGSYVLSLPPGVYLVDVSDAEGNPLPLDRTVRPQVGNAIPQEVEVRSGEITTLDFDIDTGIRGPAGGMSAGESLRPF